ncbi:MAG: 50S ribosomal protein L16 [Deltaproteobacteria bacterium]|nr:50S ribosomal protein L16 [Deltaproteobacteria bacterium]MBI4374806.1 50S ribosomal protein L16 [Deltaproteobacteria bacterium]
MLQPARLKYMKLQKGRIRGKATRGFLLSFGDYGLQALEGGLVTARQIEACRMAMARFMKKGGKVWIRIFPDKPITKKPAETRMGKGKGAVEGWAAVIKPGRVLFELEGLVLSDAQTALKLASDKLPVMAQFVTREKFSEF